IHPTTSTCGLACLPYRAAECDGPVTDFFPEFSHIWRKLRLVPPIPAQVWYHRRLHRILDGRPCPAAPAPPNKIRVVAENPLSARRRRTHGPLGTSRPLNAAVPPAGPHSQRGKMAICRRCLKSSCPSTSSTAS